jgi:ABC-type taurine transport system ATPase subunit
MVRVERLNSEVHVEASTKGIGCDGPFVLLRSVRKEYKARGAAVLAVADVTTNIREQEFLAILGPSGCGKSTLLKMIAGLVVPSGGQIIVKGQAVREPLENVGMVFQSPVLLRWRTVLLSDGTLRGHGSACFARPRSAARS